MLIFGKRAKADTLPRLRSGSVDDETTTATATKTIEQLTPILVWSELILAWP